MPVENRRLNVFPVCLVVAVLLLPIGLSSRANGQTPAEQRAAAEKTATSEPAKAEPAKSEAERHAEFSKKLSGSALVGNFTVDGRQGEMKEERYELESVTKLPTGDLWLFKTRIQYGDHDVTVPLPLKVLWAGDTPVIVVDHVTIPGLGTFDARVAIAGQRYAGTWQHGEVGGHLFGRVEAGAEK